MRAYHFVGKTLRNGDPIPADGVKLEFDGQPIMCKCGLHASIEPFDALQYAPGATLCLVECGGIIVYGDDKIVCTERTIIARFDATDFLWEASRAWALEVVHLWNAPGVVIDYLTTGNESLRVAARAAALDASWVAARTAALDASWVAARTAALDASWVAARTAALDASWVAALAAALDASWDAARDAQRRHFNDAVADEFIRMGIEP